MRASGLLLLLLLPGCGPYLREVRGPERHFAASSACTSGPLELEVTALGTRWGEFLRLRVRSPRALVGQVRVLLGEEPAWPATPWRTGTEVPAGDRTTTWVSDPRPDNARCVARPMVPDAPPAHREPLQAAMVRPPPAALASPQVGVGAPVGGAVEIVVAPPPALASPPVGVGARVGGAVEITVALPPADEGTSAGVASLPSGSAEVVGLVEEPFEPAAFPGPIHAGPARLVSVGQPSAGPRFGHLFQREWRDERQDGAAPLAPGTRLRIQIYSEEPNDYAGATFILEQGPLEPSGSAEAWRAELERRAADERREAHYAQWERRRAAADRAAFCRRQPEACRPRPTRVLTAWLTPAPPPAAAVARAAPLPRPRPPDGPPPQAPLETLPPKPAPFVDWVAGYYAWDGFRWVWFDGWWKVDEARRREAERLAAAACPPPRVEQPPPAPSPVATWRVGLWVWGRAAWTWLPGQWVASQAPHRAVPSPP